MGGAGPSMFDRVLDYGDGWMPTYTLGPDEIARRIAEPERRAEDAGRSGSRCPCTPFRPTATPLPGWRTPPSTGCCSACPRFRSRRHAERWMSWRRVPPLTYRPPTCEDGHRQGAIVGEMEQARPTGGSAAWLVVHP
ncbi:MAG: hypothetical protein ACJ72W_05000 [Actinoallomurus sp.]